MKLSAYARLATEQLNPRSRHLDSLSPLQIVQLMNREERYVASALKRAERPLAATASLVAKSLRLGGRLFFVGAGTSGRLGVLEAAECPPTFSTHPNQIQAMMAGGKSAVFRSKEGSEDSETDGVAAIRRARVTRKDILIGIAASGVTPYVQAALKEGKKRQARTILLTCNPKARVAGAQTIALKTGPEVLTGSTRLKAGTACKSALNRITLAAMVQLGKVYGNRMVDLQPKSRKLVARAVQLIRVFEGVSEPDARKLFLKAKGSVKVAVVMSRLRSTRAQAIQRLSRTRGSLRQAIA